MQVSPLLESYFLYWTSLTHVSYECVGQPSSKRHGSGEWVSDCLRLVPRKTVLRTNPASRDASVASASVAFGVLSGTVTLRPLALLFSLIS